MKIGFNAPMAGSLSEPETLARICVGAEAMGFTYATFSDHVVIPSTSTARYPYSETGEFPGASWAARHEQLIEVAFIAAKTSRLRLVTSIMVVPHRPAVLCAKMLSTIDVLSRGRLIVGAGAGWLKEEFEALDAPPFAARGAVTDEYLQAFRVLWTEDAPSFQGEHVKFGDIVFAPKPVQKPHPPIWVGGESGPALRRAARLGTAWYPIGTNPTHPLDSLARYRGGLARLHKAAADVGRDSGSIGLAYRVARHGADLPAKAADGERRLFSGSPAEIAGDLRDLGSLGVGHIDFSFAGATADDMLEAMKRFRDDVVSRV
ncbi:MAG TPA: TIGR03619 family F420-dependent LLM class oxidoreductase [Stellaceae bacterium]|nr:TIGR03619 family F420-dependent LLM class oxidoreductase [Stellaceae bacterium]